MAGIRRSFWKMMCDVKPPIPSPSLEGKRILLASNSPRRRELLGLIVPDFEVVRMSGVQERYPQDLSPEEVPAFLSLLKARAYDANMHPDEVVITADTVVIVGGCILGKPAGFEDAVAMLKQLRGRTHTVVTGVTISMDCGLRRDTFSASTEVTFGALSDHEIEEYVARYKPYDKAGAYGIQEWIGAIGIEGMNGSFYNVMGLPVKMLYDHLKNL